MRIGALLGALTLLLWTTPAAAQTGDQARLIFTISGSYAGGADLYNVPFQPLNRVPQGQDSLNLTRVIKPSIGLSFAGSYFPGSNLGLGVEAFLLGVGFRDDCTISSNQTPNARTVTVCNDLRDKEKSATAVLVTAGPVFRFNSRKIITPYARIQGGFLLSNQSPIRTVAQLDAQNNYLVYDDPKTTRITPGATLGLGVTASVGKGYQLRWEVRDNLVGVRRVTGATAVDGVEPPSELTFKHIWSFMVGFDIVLERRRGRRY